MFMPCLLLQDPLCPRTASVDHFICAEQGLIGHSKGELTTKSFQGGAVFIDTESGVGFVHLQTSIDATQTILGKQAFKCEMAKYGHAIIAYCVNNGSFAGNAFKNKVKNSKQCISYCVVGRHHQMHLQKIVLVYCVKCTGLCFFMPHCFGQRQLTLTFGHLLSVYLMTFEIYNLVRMETAILTVYHYLMLIHLLLIIIPLVVQLLYLMIASQLLETVYQNGSNAVGLVHTWETQNITLPVYLLFSI